MEGKKVINIAVIGAGFMGRTHSYAISNLKYFYKNLPFDAVLHTVCTGRLESAGKAKEELGFMYAAADFDSVVNNPDIDVIDICTPNGLHAFEIVKAAEKNKHVYCEKPAVANRDEAVIVKKALENSSRVHGIVFNNRYFPATMKAKLLFEEGRIGKVISFTGRYLHSSGLKTAGTGWRDKKEISGGGVLFDLGSHVFDLICHITGNREENEILSVSGKSHILHPDKTDCDEYFHVVSRMKSGCMGTVEVSKITLSANDDLSIEIYGEKGAIKFGLMDPGYLYFYDGAKAMSPYGGEGGYARIDCFGKYEPPGGVFPSQKAPLGWLQGHVHSMYCYLKSVYENDTGLRHGAPLRESLRINCILDAAYRSDAYGREETVKYI